MTESADLGLEKERLILLVTGANSSGKSSCARYLALALNATVVEFGDMVRRRIEVDASLPRNPSYAYEQLVRRHGSGLLAGWARSVASECGPTKALIMVGVRDEPSYRKILDEFPSAIRIAIVAKAPIRQARDRMKHAPTQVVSDTEFAKRDAQHRRWGLETILNEADHTMRNNGSCVEFHEELRLFLASLNRRQHANIIQSI